MDSSSDPRTVQQILPSPDLTAEVRKHPDSFTYLATSQVLLRTMAMICCFETRSRVYDPMPEVSDLCLEQNDASFSYGSDMRIMAHPPQSMSPEHCITSALVPSSGLLHIFGSTSIHDSPPSSSSIRILATRIGLNSNDRVFICNSGGVSEIMPDIVLPLRFRRIPGRFRA